MARTCCSPFHGKKSQHDFSFLFVLCIRPCLCGTHGTLYWAQAQTLRSADIWTFTRHCGNNFTGFHHRALGRHKLPGIGMELQGKRMECRQTVVVTLCLCEIVLSIATIVLKPPIPSGTASTNDNY